MIKYLITGISGFVAGHYLEYLSAQKPKTGIIGVDLKQPDLKFLSPSFRKRVKFLRGSLLDKGLILKFLGKHKPDFIVNLASLSSVAQSWERPAECVLNNTGSFLNILEAIHKSKIKTKILSVGSAEVYGIGGKKRIPLKERAPLNPVNPYAVSRLAQEKLGTIFASAYKTPIIMTRSFNHIGPRQSDAFAVSSFARQIIEAKKGRRDRISCGNLNAIRDFMDVRDVVRAYDLLLRKGKAGEVYNVCSGTGYRLSEVLNMLRKEAGVKIPVKTDPRLLRPFENPVMIGSPRKLEKCTGFRRQYGLSRSLRDILRYWRDLR